MATLDNDAVQEVFKLFDPDGSGIKIKEIGTVMRSLGLATSEAQTQEFVSQALKKDKNFVQFPDFLGYVREAQTFDAANSGDVTKDLMGLKDGVLHFFEKLSPKQLRDAPTEMVKIADLKHVLSAAGEKMSEEEIEDMAREIRTCCQVEDGRVKFEDFIAMLQS
mmetsp:Transcript_93877/g.265187  ORF Transcript_93877/g.265187 Transcript_93877/m.265187 type:complete len:164 (+) Transcript_93877:102-593(+)|eukprot:CAMPEP_0117523296 /NCGR_PEP_ID=MMETSP0784-20121206/34655_1 /TAXON_ID=39447 /ORGANISM="" /LENGTH=163 /DNA_ID=CAMNT_0005319405 /DNA_START=102 /DNA_END=593 /DNA_ORIENTATION=+